MQIISRTTKWEGTFIRIVLITYRGHDGKEHTWEAIERIGARGVVVIVAVTKVNELLLIRQYRPALDSFVIELPAGLVEPGEDFLDTCRRELIEETRHDSDELSLLTEGVMSTGITSDIWQVVIARNAREASEEMKRRYPPEPNEYIEVVKAPVTDFDASLESFRKQGDYIDLRIHGLVALYLKHQEGR